MSRSSVPCSKSVFGIDRSSCASRGIIRLDLSEVKGKADPTQPATGVAVKELAKRDVVAPLRVVQTLGHQLVTAVWPSRTSPMYATGRVIQLDVGAFITVGVWIALCFAAWRSGARLVLAGLLSFGLLMIPVSNLVPMYFTLQDRYLSLPLVGLSLAFAALLGGVARANRRTATIGATLLVVALGMRTVQYAGECGLNAFPWDFEKSGGPPR